MCIRDRVRCYEVAGKPFLLLSNWHLHQRIRNSKEKYPAPQTDDVFDNAQQVFDNSPQVAASRRKSRPESNPNPNPNPESESKSACAQEDDLAMFTGELRQAVKEWLAYKTEKRQGYKPTGRKTLITQIRNQADLHGDSAVSDVIRQSMASNYQGIVWELSLIHI